MSKFGEYVTSTAFRLSLSKPQIEMLCMIEQTGGSYMLLTTFRALEDKGLVERIKGSGLHLTDAGRAVLPLLKMAGLYVECHSEKRAA